MSALQGKKVIDVACGSLHCVACTDTGTHSSVFSSMLAVIGDFS